MALRDTLNEKRGAITGVAIAITVLALVFVFWQMFGSDVPKDAASGSQFYFTTDNGATRFADTKTKIPPFDKDGKLAYRVRVFSCDGGKTEFAGYLERFPESSKAKLAEYYKDPRANIFKISDLETQTGQVKSVNTPEGERNWIPISSPRSGTITDLPCPNGGGVEKRSEVFP